MKNVEENGLVAKESFRRIILNKLPSNPTKSGLLKVVSETL
jgi:hypothetical protein